MVRRQFLCYFGGVLAWAQPLEYVCSGGLFVCCYWPPQRDLAVGFSVADPGGHRTGHGVRNGHGYYRQSLAGVECVGLFASAGQCVGTDLPSVHGAVGVHRRRGHHTG